ncbi:chemokine-like receptor 1 isoform X1 [Bufo bufo]|uniref:chemokine-like receptor 1 isoform X1 n=2 Tax=Bufo bufo TaxID=8384 RepID=UPI001ABEDE56|nr:chemokine-like receptor 1 isoform X1 [Bufo bufo]XP_040276428.1 chemokine-like receptor 1 isoform X1 [Bufo bufo]XP_040276434.1 chemokine-like receptor 1 isoform X1 [Bufo bufo]XP_040276437.1 chemokine-like receptor 1 isoform X1 [Bufo bufo]XP_040276442.1 chemokine-like receptor 1 isoform X1 [Bufo bufo]
MLGYAGKTFLKSVVSFQVKKMENNSNLDHAITWEKYCNITGKEDGHHVHVTSVVSAVICALVFLLGPPVNGFVLWIKVFKMEKKYRTVLYLHLFFAGFIFSLFQFLDMVYFALDVHWPFGSFMCRLNNAIFYLYLFVSASILTLFSIDYCIVVLLPIRYNFYRTTRLASIEVLVIWIFSLAASVPYLIFKNTYECQKSSKCLYGVLHDEKVQYQSIVTSAFVLGILIPFLIIISCIIFTGLFYHRKNSSRYTTNLKLIFLIQICFFLCWIPHHVFSFLSSSMTGESLPNSFIDQGLILTMALALLTACINPLMYAFICPDFKKVFSIQSLFAKIH